MTGAIALLRRSLIRGQDWNKNDLLDAILYLRCLSAIIIGVTFGCMGYEGFYIFLGFVGFNYSSARIWLTYQEIDAEAFAEKEGGGATAGPIWFEGFPQSLMLFVLSWVTSYSLVGAP